MNIVIISGNLTKDTEYRAFDNGGVIYKHSRRYERL